MLRRSNLLTTGIMVLLSITGQNLVLAGGHHGGGGGGGGSFHGGSMSMGHQSSSMQMSHNSQPIMGHNTSNGSSHVGSMNTQLSHAQTNQTHGLGRSNSNASQHHTSNATSNFLSHHSGNSFNKNFNFTSSSFGSKSHHNFGWNGGYGKSWGYGCGYGRGYGCYGWSPFGDGCYGNYACYGSYGCGYNNYGYCNYQCAPGCFGSIGIAYVQPYCVTAYQPYCATLYQPFCASNCPVVQTTPVFETTVAAVNVELPALSSVAPNNPQIVINNLQTDTRSFIPPSPVSVASN